ncbi:MAG TPA: acetyltransferase [Burkholderiaceae bacterium]|nr:acetyltransferase [Burkholderiaceae bacterium]
MAMTALAIWGTSGHARMVTAVAQLAKCWQIIGYIDDVFPQRHGSQFCGAPVLGGREVLSDLIRRGVRQLFIGFGANEPRRRLADELATMGFQFPTLVHPNASVASDAQLGAGVFVGPGAIVNAAASVGEQSIVNSGAIVEHDVRVGRSVHVAPAAVLAGWVQVDECAWIGAGALVRDRLTVGARALVGMGAVVTRPVAADTVVIGCPARPMRRRAT